MAKGRKPTIDDVAAAAGVSAITVSRALRQPKLLSPATMARVEEAVRALDYAPNPAASSLARGRSDLIGVVIPSIANNIFADVLLGLYEALDGAPHQIQIANTFYDPALEERALASFVAQRPAGLVVTGVDQSAAGRDLLRRAACPIVQIMDVADGVADMAVGLTHEAVGAAAAAHLLEAGYARPGMIEAQPIPRSRRRARGFFERLALEGADDRRRAAVDPRPSSLALGAELLGELLARHPDADAAFCHNDDLALGALFELQRRGVAVPEQFGLCGFNDLDLAAAAQPSLTSVRIERRAMGEQAAAMIAARLAGATPTPARVDLGFAVMARQSTDRSGGAAAARRDRRALA